MNDAERRLITSLEMQEERLVFTRSDNAKQRSPGQRPTR